MSNSTYNSYLNDRNHRIKNSGLTESDQEIIQGIMGRMSIFKVNSRDAILIQEDLLGMAKECAMRNEDFSNVIGSDTKGFADRIVESAYGPSLYEIVLRLFSEVLRFFMAVGLLSIAGIFLSWEWGQVPILLMAFWLVISIVSPLVQWTLGPKYAFEKGIKKHTPKLIFLISVIIFALFLVDRPSYLVTIPINSGFLLGISAILFVVCERLLIKFIEKA